MRHTTDLDSSAGTAQMAHQDEDVLEREYERMKELQSTLFEVESE